MQISIGSPTHGWMPFSILIGGRRVEYRASNVLNDPVADLLFAAIWSLDIDFELPSIADPPLTTDTCRCAHFWLEPAWHTLKVEMRDYQNLDLWFAVNHTGGLYVTERDMNQTHLTLTGASSPLSFASAIHQAIDDLVRRHADACKKHWKHPFPYSTFEQLGEWLDLIQDAEASG